MNCTLTDVIHVSTSNVKQKPRNVQLQGLFVEGGPYTVSGSAKAHKAAPITSGDCIDNTRSDWNSSDGTKNYT